MQDALKDIHVLEVGVMTPGKYCGFLLTGWGAVTTRIERDALPETGSNEDLLLNRNKQTVVLNLKEDDARAEFIERVRTSDVLIESYRPGVTKRLGIDYESVKQINERLVYCSLSGFGQDGPDKDRAAYDLVFLAESGLLHALFGNASDVVPPQTWLGDAVSGLMAAFAISAALQTRNRTGRGRYIDLSMQESLFSLLSVSHGTICDGTAVAGNESSMRSRRPVYNVYRTGDNRHIAITALREESCRTLFRQLGNETMWQDGMEIGAAGDAATAFLETCFAERDAQYWLDVLGPLGIEIALVRTPEEAFGLEQLKERRMSITRSDSDGRQLQQIGYPATHEPYGE
jgi:crotonobetainyl-CoA:carnitine CoA-transferase CaiB-like acyl-CoA transferase